MSNRDVIVLGASGLIRDVLLNGSASRAASPHEPAIQAPVDALED